MEQGGCSSSGENKGEGSGLCFRCKCGAIMFHGIMMSYPVKQSRKRFFILPSGARWGCNDIPIVQGGQGDAEATICFPASAYLGEGEKLTL